MKNVDVKNVKVVATKNVKKVSNYSKNVLSINAKLKSERKSLGGCIKTLIAFSKEIDMSAKDIKTLRFIQKDKVAYVNFKKTVRTSKYKGKDLKTYSPFYVLQALYKSNKA